MLTAEQMLQIGPVAEVLASLAPDDDAAEMYLWSLDRLDRAGYRQYEISNVARPGREHRPPT